MIVITRWIGEIIDANLNIIRCAVIPELNGLSMNVIILFPTKFDMMFQWTRLEKFQILTDIRHEQAAQRPHFRYFMF